MQQNRPKVTKTPIHNTLVDDHTEPMIFYKDIGKPTIDLFENDYFLPTKFQWKGKNPENADITVGGELSYSIGEKSFSLAKLGKFIF